MSVPALPARACDPHTHAMRPASTSERPETTRARPLRAWPKATAQRRPAQRAAARMFALDLALGTFALASAFFVFTRLLESWRVGSRHAPEVVSMFGQRLSYPLANTGAIVVAALAALGLVILIATARAAVRELRADRRFRRAMATQERSSLLGTRIIDSDQPQAFCAGLVRPEVFLSRGALELLSAAELSAVLAHERHHASRRDPLRLAVTRVLADTLFFVPALRRVIARQQSLAEIGADEAAVASAGGDRVALASAMLNFSEASGADAAGLAPERIDYLVGETGRWRLPLALLLGIAFCLAVVVALAILAAETASGSASLALPLVSSAPCVVMLALIPAAAASAGVLHARGCSRSARLARVGVGAQPGVARR
jgi:Zn-dependent protease with chaperone function